MKPVNILFAFVIAAIFLLLINQWPQSNTSGHKTIEAGNRYFEDGHYVDASKSFAAIIDQDPYNIEAIRGLARSYMQLEKYYEALHLFNKAIALAPEFAASYANRGILHDRMKKYQLAIKDYRQALNLQPNLAKGPGWLTRFLRNQAERPSSILDRLNYLEKELQKPAQERLLNLPEQDRQQRPYKIDAE